MTYLPVTVEEGLEDTSLRKPLEVSGLIFPANGTAQENIVIVRQCVLMLVSVDYGAEYLREVLLERVSDLLG